MRSFTIDTANTTQVVTTAECKTHLRVDHSEDDTYIATLERAATATAEGITNRYFLNTTLNQFGDTWEELCTLFRSPVSSVTHIKYYDEDNNQTTLATSVYQKDLEQQPARIGLKPSQSFPSLANRINAVECQYVVGYGSAASSVPEGIKQAILIMVGDWYENRQSVIVGRVVNQIPKTAEYLLNQYKVQVL